MVWDELSRLLTNSANRIGVHLTSEQVILLLDFSKFLLEENKRQNLTAIANPEEVIVKHVLDSLSCLLVAGLNRPSRVVDVGTGAGFPGIPLAVVRDELEVTLVDSRKKRVEFLQKAMKKLGLPLVEIILARAEELGQKEALRQKYDVAASRAVASLNTLAEYCLPLVKVDGLFLAMKGPDIEKELTAGRKAVRVLGGQVEQVLRYRLPVLGHERSIIIIRKTDVTPEEYPRRVGIPAKRPL